ncbi:MAG: SHD1 domain-containing protein [Pirellulales bacterium]
MLRSTYTLIVLVTCIISATVQQRTWTDNTGKHQIEADLVEVKDGIAVLKKPSGKTVDVPLNRLSSADRKYIQSLNKPAQKETAELPFTEQEAIDAIRKLGGSVTGDQQHHGKTVMGEGLTVSFKHRMNVTDAKLVCLKGLINLRGLILYQTQVTGAGLVYLKGMTKLELLDLMETKVSNAGLVHLKELTGLKDLRLIHVNISDAGLVHLKMMTKLEKLVLAGNRQLSGDGVSNLKAALPHCEISH